MSRRRYLSTEISIDTAVNRLARSAGDFAVMLYTWMIPHCDDDGIVHGDAEEIILQVIPGRRDKKIEDVTTALAAMQEHGLIEWDQEGRRVVFPAASFYKYQTYIKEDRRRGASGADNNNAPEVTQDADNAAKQRKTAQNTVSVKHSLSHPVKHSHSEKRQPTVATPPQAAHRAMFGALAESFGKPTPGAEQQRYERAAKELITAGADPSEIPRLCEAWEWVNPGPPRVNSLAGQLTVLRNAKPRTAPTNGKHPTPIRVDTAPIDSRWADVTFEAKRWTPEMEVPRFDDATDRAIEALGGWQEFVRSGARREAFDKARMGVSA
jgi:hypothetical protein